MVIAAKYFGMAKSFLGCVLLCHRPSPGDPRNWQRLLEHIHHQVEQEPTKQKNKDNQREPHEDKPTLIVTRPGCSDADYSMNRPKNFREEVDHRRWWRRNAIRRVHFR
jgi:hypothetical protein